MYNWLAVGICVKGQKCSIVKWIWNIFLWCFITVSSFGILYVVLCIAGLTERVFNFPPCWSDYSNGHPWGVVIRLLVVLQPVATKTAIKAPHISTLWCWMAPNWHPLLDSRILPLRLKTYCVARLADGNLFVRTSDTFGQRSLCHFLFLFFSMTYLSESRVLSISCCSGMMTSFFPHYYP